MEETVQAENKGDASFLDWVGLEEDDMGCSDEAAKKNLEKAIAKGAREVTRQKIVIA